MKTFKGDMLEYIFEEPSVYQHILNNRKLISCPFVETVKDRNINRIIFTGAGTSNYSPQSVRTFFEKITGLSCYVVLATGLSDGNYKIDQQTLVIGISATGSSVNTIEALRYSKNQGAITVAVTNELESRFAKENDTYIYLDYGVEDVSPKSKSYLCEMLSLTICALELALAINKINETEYTTYLNRLEMVGNNLGDVINQSKQWIVSHVTEFKNCKRLLVIGYGANIGNINEGALKILECGRFQTCCYELEEFMHGIYHSIDSDCYIVFLLNNSHYRQRALCLRKYLSQFTSHIYVISKDVYHDELCLDVNWIDDKEFYYLEDIVPLQLMSYYIAKTKGINPNIPSDINFHQIMNSKV